MLTYPPLPVDSVDKVDNLYKPTWTGPYQHLLDGRLSSTVVDKVVHILHILYIDYCPYPHFYTYCIQT
jgi:hypothetical protein